MHSSVTATRSPRRLATLTLGLAIFVGCSSTGSGCSTLTPFPAGTHYSGPKSSHGISIRLSAAGINYLNANWRTLIDAFAPGAVMTLPFACQKTSVSVLGDVYIADQGNGSTGRNDGKCDGNDLPVQVPVHITGFSLQPVPGDTLKANISITLDTGKIYLTNPHTLCDLKCSVRFNSAGHTPNDNRLEASVKFSIDSRFDQLLGFTISKLDGTQICGASGAPSAPTCLDAQDLNLDSEGGFCSYACDGADWDPIKEFVLQQISPTLQGQVTAAIAGQTCWTCDSNADCPRTTDGNNTPATCDTASHTCKLGGTCVPRFLGVEGTLNLASLLGSFGAPADASMQLSVAAGALVQVDQGLSLSTRVGIQPAAVSSCVPPQAAPTLANVDFPDFEAEAAPGSPFHVGLGLSSGFLNTAFWGAHQAGALCLNLTTENVGLINTGLFKTFLPSLGRISTRDGKDAPMMVVLRPAKPPTVTVGAGTYDATTHKPIKPLLTIALDDVSIDFYALIDDRQVRLFTLTADIALPLSLIFEDCDTVTPAIGDLRMLISNIRTANSELLAEDPQVLADLVPAVIGLAEPALASGLSGFALPALGSFKLKVNEAKGLGQIPGSDAYNHLGIYAQLLGANDSCATGTAKTSASLRSLQLPEASQMRLQGRALPLPVALLDVSAVGMPGSPEYDFRIDDGLWTEFRAAEGGVLPVTSARLLMQGQHTIWVRSRMAEVSHAVSDAVAVPVLIDWEPPEVSLSVDRPHDRVVVRARDVVSGDRLEFAYAVGDAGPGAFGPPREIALSSVDAQGGVTVWVRDEVGNVAEAHYAAPVVASRPDTPSAGEVADPLPLQGCSSVAGLDVLGLLALGLFLRRR